MNENEIKYCKRIFFKDRRTPILGLILNVDKNFIYIKKSTITESYPLINIDKIQETDIVFEDMRC